MRARSSRRNSSRRVRGSSISAKAPSCCPCCRAVAAIRWREQIHCDGGAVCNMAAGDFPTQAGNNGTSLSCLACSSESPMSRLSSRISASCKRDVILSYRAADLGGDRAGLANQFSFYELALLFDRYGFRIACTAQVGAGEHLMRLTPSDRLPPYRLQRGGGVGQRPWHLRRPAWRADDQRLAAGRSRRPSFEFRRVARGARQVRFGDPWARHGMFQPLIDERALQIVSRGR